MNAFRFRLGATIALAALSIAAVADAQQVYSWKDAKGVTHYSDSPPPAGAKTKREIQVPAVAPAVATVSRAPAAQVAKAADAAATKPAKPVETEAQRAAREANCKTAQANLAILQGKSAVAVDEDGDGKNDKVLDDKARATEAQAAQDVITTSCAPAA
jgi:hypothetical protein